jgi:hypothetical protein
MESNPSKIRLMRKGDSPSFWNELNFKGIHGDTKLFFTCEIKSM